MSTPYQQLLTKIIPLANIRKIATQWRSQNQSLVFTNGCFDLIHRGHIDYLSKAAALGNKLIIGLNTDKSVQSIKGTSRPFQDETTRAMILAALFFTDAIVLFDTDTPYELIKMISPDVLVKGDDYVTENIIGYDIVTQGRGVVKTIPFIAGFSTTLLVEKIQKTH